MEEVDGLTEETYSVRRILPNETWAIRALVLWPEKQPDSSCALPDDGDAGVMHFGVTRGSVVVGVGTFMPQTHLDLEASIGYRLRAMATHPDHRGRGVGARLIRHAEGVLRDGGEGGIWADARKVALGFYAGLGWEVSGPFYTVPKRGPHRLVWTRFDA
jgi:GNAT superfamily N-acetyltransferase